MKSWVVLFTIGFTGCQSVSKFVGEVSRAKRSELLAVYPNSATRRGHIHVF